ncbi:MAG: hypothetical protein FD149_1017 [Rhodospirillaceae bacterium]|nr:MAG: hypothetical protein FD149_1017 [Rhodospirillaceae bacterium]
MTTHRVRGLAVFVGAALAVWFVMSFLTTLETMTAVMGRVSEDIHGISTAASAMRQDTARMVDHAAAMQQAVVALDRNLNQINHDIAGIQNTMAEDIERMRIVLDGIGQDMGAVNGATQRMNAFMGRMTYGMDRLANTISPLGGLGMP